MLTNRQKKLVKNAAKKTGGRYLRVDPLARRQALADLTREKAEDGKVALVASGLDCDCVQWSRASVVKAQVMTTIAWENHEEEWADGTWSYFIERPSVAATYEYGSRDLALEAFEDGHPHVVYA